MVGAHSSDELATDHASSLLRLQSIVITVTCGRFLPLFRHSFPPRLAPLGSGLTGNAGKWGENGTDGFAHLFHFPACIFHRCERWGHVSLHLSRSLLQLLGCNGRVFRRSFGLFHGLLCRLHACALLVAHPNT